MDRTMSHPTDQFTPSGYESADDESRQRHATSTPSSSRASSQHEFQIVRLLGRGAMGSVYLARDLALHRVVAIKVLRWDLAASVDDTERFRREARTTGQLSHPSIVPLHSFGESPNLMYMVMRYVPGESLGARIRRLGKLSPEETRRILAELALTLEYAHREGIVHRDLKPENILLEISGESIRPMVADFGVAMRRSYDPPPGAAQAVEHYEIETRYGTLIAWARQLGHQDCARVLTQNLEEEPCPPPEAHGDGRERDQPGGSVVPARRGGRGHPTAAAPCWTSSAAGDDRLRIHAGNNQRAGVRGVHLAQKCREILGQLDRPKPGAEHLDEVLGER